VTWKEGIRMCLCECVGVCTSDCMCVCFGVACVCVCLQWHAPSCRAPNSEQLLCHAPAAGYQQRLSSEHHCFRLSVMWRLVMHWRLFMHWRCIGHWRLHCVIALALHWALAFGREEHPALPQTSNYVQYQLN